MKKNKENYMKKINLYMKRFNSLSHYMSDLMIYYDIFLSKYFETNKEKLSNINGENYIYLSLNEIRNYGAKRGKTSAKSTWCNKLNLLVLLGLIKKECGIKASRLARKKDKNNMAVQETTNEAIFGAEQ